MVGAACSFSADTEVLMADGTTKPISEIEVGDWVLAEDPETGRTRSTRGEAPVGAPRMVCAMMSHQDNRESVESRLCCSCATRSEIDSICMALSSGSQEAQMVVWAHMTCLSERLDDEFRSYLVDSLRTPAGWWLSVTVDIALAGDCQEKGVTGLAVASFYQAYVCSVSRVSLRR